MIRLLKKIQQLVNENEISTEINMVFVSTVNCTRHNYGDWRQSRQRCHIICVLMYSYYLWVLTIPLSMYSRCVWQETWIHIQGSCFRKPEYNTQVSNTQSNDGHVWIILCNKSISDESMSYDLNLSTCNNNKNNVLLFYEMKIITRISFPDQYKFAIV